MTSIAAYPKQFFPWLQAFFAPKPTYRGTTLWQQGEVYRHAITALCAKLVSVDGKANPSESAAFGALFPEAPTQHARTRRLFDIQAQDGSPAVQYAHQLRALGADTLQRKALLDQLIQLANCDAPINAAELEMLREMARIWAIDAEAFRASVSRVLKSKSSSPYEVLGVHRHASDAVVRARYLEQVRFMHPDQFTTTDASAETLEILSERMADVNAAYNQIAHARKGLKHGASSKRFGMESIKGARR